jgi:hypothetical protein
LISVSGCRAQTREVAEMRLFDGIGIAVLMVLALDAAPARAGEGAVFDGRIARRELAARYEKVKRERERSWKDDDEDADKAEPPPERQRVKGATEGSLTPETPRSRSGEPPRAAGR